MERTASDDIHLEEILKALENVGVNVEQFRKLAARGSELGGLKGPLVQLYKSHVIHKHYRDQLGYGSSIDDCKSPELILM